MNMIWYIHCCISVTGYITSVSARALKSLPSPVWKNTFQDQAFEVLLKYAKPGMIIGVQRCISSLFQFEHHVEYGTFQSFGFTWTVFVLWTAPTTLCSVYSYKLIEKNDSVQNTKVLIAKAGGRRALKILFLEMMTWTFHLGTLLFQKAKMILIILNKMDSNLHHSHLCLHLFLHLYSSPKMTHQVLVLFFQKIL